MAGQRLRHSPCCDVPLEHLPVHDPARERDLPVWRERDRPDAPGVGADPCPDDAGVEIEEADRPSLPPNAAVSPSRLAAAESTSLETGKSEQSAGSRVEHVRLRAETDQLPPVRYIGEGGRSRGADHRADDPSARVGELDGGSLCDPLGFASPTAIRVPP